MDKQKLKKVIVAIILLSIFILIVQVTSSPEEMKRTKKSDEKDQLIDNLEELAINIDPPHYSEDMSTEELEVVLRDYSAKINRLQDMEHQLDSKFYTDLRSDMENNRAELFELIRKRREEEFEWNVLESREELDEHYNTIISGLTRAKNLGVIKEVKQTFVLDDTDYELTIDQVWPSSEGFYLLYHIKVGEVPKGRLFHYLRVQQENHNLREVWRSQEFVYFNGSIYGAVKYRTLDGKTNDSNLYDIGVQVGHNQMHHFTNISIPVQINKEIEANYKFTVPIDRVVSQNGTTITIDRLEHRLGGNSLYLTAEQSQIFGLVGEIDDEPISEFKYQSFHKNNSKEFKLPIKSSNELPDHIKVELSELQLVTDRSLTFEVDTSIIEYGESVTINKPIGQVYGTQYFLDHLAYEDDGLFVYLRMENKYSNHQYEVPMFMASMNSEFNNVTILNSNGDEIRDQYYRTDVKPHKSLFGFTIPGDGETYRVNLSNLLIRINFYDQFNVEVKEQ